MPSPWEIKQKANHVESVRRDITRARDNVQRLVDDTKRWWDSQAGHKLRNEYREISWEITSLASSLLQLETSVGQLSRDVEKADEQRKEAKRLAVSTSTIVPGLKK